MSAPTPMNPEIHELPQELPEPPRAAIAGSVIFIGFIIFWLLGSTAALIMSLVCFGLSGSTMEKVVGLAIAFFLGPLYFIFYGFNKGYCRNLGANVIKTTNTILPSM